MKILFVGDLHGNAVYFKNVVSAANLTGSDVIVQCGDLGFWPHVDPDYTMFLYKKMAKTDEWRAERGLEPLFMVWVDGNHENFDMLWEEGVSRELTPEGFWMMNDRVLYAPRGLRWEWDGVSFLALGGANSIDKHYRKPHSSWWQQELITPRNVRDAIADGEPVDVMVCHDMPDGVKNGPELWFKNQPEDEGNRKNVRAVMDAVRPKLLVHGHYHYRYQDRLNGTRIVGLDCDQSYSRNWYIWTTSQLNG